LEFPPEEYRQDRGAPNGDCLIRLELSAKFFSLRRGAIVMPGTVQIALILYIVIGIMLSGIIGNMLPKKH